MENITKSCEFHNPFEVLEWRTLKEGMREAILYIDKNSGTYSRMLQLDPGCDAGSEAMEHEFDEMVYIVSGGLVNERLNERYKAGNFAFFPAGTKHGPLAAPVGAVVVEVRHYKK